MKEIRIGIIGAGTMGGVHASCYQEIPEVQVAAICEFEPGEGRELAQKAGAKLYSTVDALIEDPAVEVVDICTPTHLHAQHVLQAVAAGKHVICEKPLARNLSEAEKMIETCDKVGVKLFVGHVVRFFPEYALARRILESGRIGKPAVIRTSRNGSFPRGKQNWFGNRQLSLGPIGDLLIHDFDFLRWCFGEVERVYAKTLHSGQLPDLDYALVTLRFRRGPLAHCEGSWAHAPGTFFVRFEIAASDGLIEYDSRKNIPITLTQRKPIDGTTPRVAIPESPLTESPYTTELRHFILCLTQGTEPLVTAYDALKALEIALAALDSAKTGKPVELKED